VIKEIYITKKLRVVGEVINYQHLMNTLRIVFKVILVQMQPPIRRPPHPQPVTITGLYKKKLTTLWLWSAGELYRPSDRRLLAKLVQTFLQNPSK
jgi:hypothetical protein